MSREGSQTAITSASGALLDGHEVVAEHQFDRNGAQQIVLDLEIFEVDELGAIARGQRFGLGRSSCPTASGVAINVESVSHKVVTPCPRRPTRARRSAGKAR